MTDLEQEVQQLKEQVKKMQILLASTGKQVMELQMENRKAHINDIGTKTEDLQTMVPGSRPGGLSGANPATRPSEYVTESDLGDMVMELQGQLTLLDERSIRRVLNSRSSSALTPLPNADGEYNPDAPKTIADVQNLSNQALFDQWNFFEMLPNGEKLEDLLDSEDTPEAKSGNAKVMQEIYESFVRYLGLNPAEYPRK